MAELNLGQWLDTARGRLKGISEQAGLEASLLASSLLAKPRSWILAYPEENLTTAQVTLLNLGLERLASGTPLPYITGVQEFYGLKFSVNPAVLIPRPETELLVDQAINWLLQSPNRRRGLDVGTGSGCISVAIAAAVGDMRMIASDLSRSALVLARANAAANGVLARVTAVLADLTAPFLGPYDLVCANLPYIPSPTLAGLSVGRYEPLLALDGGPDGLTLIRRMLVDLPRILAPGGLALLEIEHRQGTAVTDLASQNFPCADIQTLQDLAGLNRLIRIKNSPEPVQSSWKELQK